MKKKGGDEKRGKQCREGCFEGSALIDLLVPLTFLDKIRLTPWLGWLIWAWTGAGGLSGWCDGIGIPDRQGDNLCLTILVWFGCIEKFVDAVSRLKKCRNQVSTSFSISDKMTVVMKRSLVTKPVKAVSVLLSWTWRQRQRRTETERHTVKEGSDGGILLAAESPSFSFCPPLIPVSLIIKTRTRKAVSFNLIPTLDSVVKGRKN